VNFPVKTKAGAAQDYAARTSLSGSVFHLGVLPSSVDLGWDKSEFDAAI